ncbi:MAG TPA: glucose-6-phosphate isomerase [Verrucomicrobiae bacterium]|jgi:glucose-6-phosphate isomerase|nr:glucose-6-phosphate isomerase [Verrucomicrobiae bacterium]
MKPVSRQLWDRFQKYYSEYPTIGLALDLSRMNFPEDYFDSMEVTLQKEIAEMAALERGAITNSNEEQMVSRYWMRNPALAPTPELRAQIESTLQAIKDFAGKVHGGFIAGVDGPFENLLIIGHGRATLGVEFLAEALSNPAVDGLIPFFFDTTDPDGMERVLNQLGEDLGKTLCVVIATNDERETRNGMTGVRSASELDILAASDGRLARFPGDDWVSELLSVALQGFGTDELLRGGRYCDEITRVPDVKSNPAAQLFLIFYGIFNGTDQRKVAILPYKDRLSLFSRYLRPLAADLVEDESDQSPVIFIQTLRDQAAPPFFVEERVTAGDYLQASWLGKRQAAYENGQESVSLTLQSISPFELGALIALFDRALGFLRLSVNVNVNMGLTSKAKETATIATLDLQVRILAYLNGHGPSTIAEIGRVIGSSDLETIFWVCEHLAANPDRRIEKMPGTNPFEVTYGLSTIS